MLSTTAFAIGHAAVPDAPREAPMEFRWVAVLSLWTLLSGPILTQPAHQPPVVGPRLDAQPPAGNGTPASPGSPAVRSQR